MGLAAAAHLAERFPDSSVTVLERHEGFGRETSSRNSEVIHAGIYYPPGSLKARLCVEGNRLLYAFCRAGGVPHLRIGKLIVAATDSEAAVLESLLERGRQNGVPGLRMLGRRETAGYEPHVSAVAALYSASTGVLDCHRLMARLELLAAGCRAVLAYRHEVTGIEHAGRRHTVLYRDPAGRQCEIRCTWIVNSAGLCADRIASLMGIDTDSAGYRLHFCKGEYFRIPPAQSRRLFHLIYPPPYNDLRGLGIHVTKSLDGTVKLGPNALYVDSIDYSVDPEHAQAFYRAVKQYLPFLKPGDLQPDTAGVRPKLQAPGMPIQDFVVCHETARGLAGCINLIGIESPGLSACLSLARQVGDIIAGSSGQAVRAAAQTACERPRT